MPTHPLTPAELAIIEARLRAGEHVSTIARLLHRGFHAIDLIRQDLGIARHSPGGHGGHWVDHCDYVPTPDQIRDGEAQVIAARFEHPTQSTPPLPWWQVALQAAGEDFFGEQTVTELPEKEHRRRVRDARLRRKAKRA